MTAYQVYDIPIFPTEAQALTLERHISLAAEAYDIATRAPRAAFGPVRKDYKRHLAVIQSRPDMGVLPLAAIETAVRSARNAVCANYRNGESGALPTARRDSYRIVQKPDRIAVARFGKLWLGGTSSLRAYLLKVGYVLCEPPPEFDFNAPISSIEIGKAHGQWSIILRVKIDAEVNDPAPEVIPPRSTGIRLAGLYAE